MFGIRPLPGIAGHLKGFGPRIQGFCAACRTRRDFIPFPSVSYGVTWNGRQEGIQAADRGDANSRTLPKRQG
ncbi:uncharacterized protein Dmul_26110 [Desulfococcus multivorans]|nr:uncharacterized protein Dmul_26110 [Desulfococcus multivorans]